MIRHRVSTLFLALAGALAVSAAQAQDPAVGGKYTAGTKDTVIGIAKKVKYPKATANQVALAIVRANVQAFALKSVPQFSNGTELVIPAEADALKVAAPDADKAMARLAKADQLYRSGVQAEKNGNVAKAMRAYLTAAHMGHGLADLRLGELYDWDPEGKVQHDLLESIRFYQAARKAGVSVEGPLKRSPSLTAR